MGLVKPKNLSRLFIFDTVDFRIRIHNLIQRIKFEESRSATQKPPGRHKNNLPSGDLNPRQNCIAHQAPNSLHSSSFPSTETSRRCSDWLQFDPPHFFYVKVSSDPNDDFNPCIRSDYCVNFLFFVRSDCLNRWIKFQLLGLNRWIWRMKFWCWEDIIVFESVNFKVELLRLNRLLLNYQKSQGNLIKKS